MKTNTNIQYRGKDIQIAELEKKAKDVWKEQGRLVKDLNTVDLYVKVEESKCYYVLNGTVTGDFDI